MAKKLAKKKPFSTSVVIPVYNGQRTIGWTIKTILNQSLKADEIVTVDDGSTDSTANILRQLPVKYVYQKNAGPASARNTGWRNAKGEIVVFTDSDCIPDKEWLEELVKPFIDSSTGAVGGEYKTANSEILLARLIGLEFDYRYAQMGDYIDAHGSYNLAVRKKILEKIKGFNEGYPVPTAEDFDLCYKIAKQGYKIALARRAEVAGFHRESLRRYLKDQIRHGYYRMHLYKDHPEKVSGDTYSGSAKLQVILGYAIFSLFLTTAASLVFWKDYSVYFCLSLFSFLFVLLLNQFFLFAFVLRKAGIFLALMVSLLQIPRILAWTWGATQGGIVYGNFFQITKQTILSFVGKKSFNRI